MDASIAVGSGATYSSGLRRFQRFVRETAALVGATPPPAHTLARDLRALLAEPAVVAAFIGVLFLEGLEAKSVRCYLAAVRHHATDLHEGPPPLTAGCELVLRGYVRLGPIPKPQSPRSRCPCC